MIWLLEELKEKDANSNVVVSVYQNGNKVFTGSWKEAETYIYDNIRPNDTYQEHYLTNDTYCDVKSYQQMRSDYETFYWSN